MPHQRRRPTDSRTDYQTYRPAPPAAPTLVMAALPLVAAYLLTHPVVVTTLVVATTLASAALRRA